MANTREIISSDYEHKTDGDRRFEPLSSFTCSHLGITPPIIHTLSPTMRRKFNDSLTYKLHSVLSWGPMLLPPLVPQRILVHAVFMK
jgi:hypothetical protein